MEYPVRSSHFAHKFSRLLHKSCAAQEIGASVCFMLTIIAHTEDAARYRGFARFWNSQLMETMGFRSAKQLDAARDKAIAAGWLYYNRAGNRQVGEYCVLIPDRYKDMEDTPIEDVKEISNRSLIGSNTERIGNGTGTESGMNLSQIGNGTGTESGKPSNPLPFPDPLPKEECSEANESPSPPTPETKKAKYKPADISKHVYPMFGTVAEDSDPYWMLMKDQVEEWQNTFTAVNAESECRKAHAWVKAHWNKRKTKGGMIRFLYGWLSREHDKGGRQQQPAKQQSEVTYPKAKQMFTFEELEAIEAKNARK